MQPILMERLGEMSSRATATGEPLCRGGVADGCAKEPRETLPNRRDRRAVAPFSTCTFAARHYVALPLMTVVYPSRCSWITGGAGEPLDERPEVFL